MSGLPLTTEVISTASRTMPGVSDAKPLTISVDMQEAVSLAGSMPAAVQGAIRALMFDVVDNHRRRVISRAGQNFPGKRAAQKMVAARLRRFTKVDPSLGPVAGVVGESALTTLPRDRFAPSVLRLLEDGGTVTSREHMFVPFDAPSRKRFEAAKAAGRIRVFRRRSGPPIVADLGRQWVGAGARSRPLGVLVRRRRQRPLLGFFRLWGETISKRQGEFVKAINDATTVAGQQRLIRSQAKFVAAAQAYRDVVQIARQMGSADHPEVKQVAAEAARMVRSGLSREQVTQVVAAAAGGGIAKFRSRDVLLGARRSGGLAPGFAAAAKSRLATRLRENRDGRVASRRRGRTGLGLRRAA